MRGNILPQSGIREIYDRAKLLEAEGKEIIHLGVGQPDWQPPPGAVEGINESLRKKDFSYTANRGFPELRQLLANEIYLQTERKFDPDTEIILTHGASESLSMCGLAILEAGDEVIIPSPAWNHYSAVTIMAGATPIDLSLSPENGFIIDPEQLESHITQRTKMLVLTSPSNPTAAKQPREVLDEVAKLSEKYGFFVFSDEVYDNYVYDGKHESIGKFMNNSDKLIYVNSFSKSYCLPGWRLGYVAASEKISLMLNKVHQYLTVCNSPIVQRGAIHVLKHHNRSEYLSKLSEEFKSRLKIWQEFFRLYPDRLKVFNDDGAFYLFPKVNYMEMNGREFVIHMLEKYGVAMVPGDVFGKVFGQYVRISYGKEPQIQHKAVEIMKRAFDKNG